MHRSWILWFSDVSLISNENLEGGEVKPLGYLTHSLIPFGIANTNGHFHNSHI